MNFGASRFWPIVSLQIKQFQHGGGGSNLVRVGLNIHR